MRVLVYGLAVAGASVARALVRRGYDVIAADDELTAERVRIADELGIEVIERPDADVLSRLVASSGLVVPSPGLPEHHRLIELAHRHDVGLASEIELAYRWEQQRPGGARPMVAVTGTDGKTTTTLMTAAMLRAGGLRTVDAGNTDTPLVDAIELDIDAIVVECTSFRLAYTPTVRAEAAAWLNLAPDHLNWHASMVTYEAAKARIWANQRTSDAAIGFVDDPVVMGRLAQATGRRRTFGLADADYRVEHMGTPDAVLVGPTGPITAASTMRRALPHDLTNALAASAMVLEAGLVDERAIAAALSDFVGPAHRLEHVGTWGDVAWFNDSKATTPHAAAAAVRSFDRLVLIAGGYDKGVDLEPMAAETDRVDAVIALGDTAPAIVSAFEGVAQITQVADMAAAVAAARRFARPGSTVLLSPGCASFDQYDGFERRGDHFRELVLDHAANPDAHTQGEIR